MSNPHEDWGKAVLLDVLQEYPEATPLTSGEVTGNAIIQLTPGWVFKVLSPDREQFQAFERRLWALLEEACGPDYAGVFLPQKAMTISGHEGFKSQRFGSTLLDLVLDPHVDMDQMAVQMRAGLDAAFSLFKRLRKQTLGQLDPRFLEEARLTFEYIAENVYERSSRPGELLRRIATQLDRFLPTEGSWCHRDVHLDNLAMLDGAWLLFDPIPTLEQRPEYVSRVEHLEPPIKGHVFLDYAKLLISLEREAGRLDHANWDHPTIRLDCRANLDRSAQIERRNLLLRLRGDYEKRAEREVGRAALHVGYVVYYGLYSICPCGACNNWGIKASMIASLRRAINQLLADDLATRLGDSRAFTPITGGTQQCLLYEMPFNRKHAVLKIETASSAEESPKSEASGEVTRNLAGYWTMPPAFRPSLFASGEYERLPFLLMQHAGVSLREKLAAPFDESLLAALTAQLREAYETSAIRDPEQARQCYIHLLDLLEENITVHIAGKHPFEITTARQVLAALRRAPARALPDWCFWTTTDFTVDNLFFTGDRFVLIDPKEALSGLFEIDIGMFPTLIGIYSSSARDGRSAIDHSNVAPYRDRLFQLATDARNSVGEMANCQPFLTLGEAWQCVLSCRFRDGDEAKQLYDEAITKLQSVSDALHKRNEGDERDK